MDKMSLEQRMDMLDSRLTSIMKMFSGMMDKEEADSSEDESMSEKMDKNNSLLKALADRAEKDSGNKYMPYAG